MDVRKKIKELMKKEKLYATEELTMRMDSQTGNLCLYTYKTRKTGNPNEIFCQETNVKNPENVIRWVGHQLPARPKWAKNYLNKSDYERYSQMLQRKEIFSQYLEEGYDKDKLYTQKQLVQIIDRINRRRNQEKSIMNIRNPEIEKAINSKNPYTICDLLEQTKGGLNGIYLRALEDAIVKTNDIVQIYEFLFLAVDGKIAGFDRERFETIIRKSQNPKLMSYCMAFVPGINLERMLDSLEKTQCAKYMEVLKNDEEYDDVYEQVKQIDPDYDEKIEAAKKFDWFPASLKELIGLKSDVEALKRQVKASKNPHWITELANYLEYLKEYKEQFYEIEDLTAAQEEIRRSHASI